MDNNFNIGRLKAEAIAKAFGIDIEKGRHGIYEDNAENRRLNRVGQEYGHKAEEKQSVSKQREQIEQEKKTSAATMESAAQGASDEALKRASQDPKAPEDVKAAAKKELANRGGGNSESQASKFSRQEVKLIRALARRSSWDSDAYNDFYKLADLMTPENATKVQRDMGCFKAASKIKEYILDNIYSGNIDFSNANVLNRNLYSLNAAEGEMDSWAKRLAYEGVKVDFVEDFPIERVWESQKKNAAKLRKEIDIPGIIFAYVGTKGYWGSRIKTAEREAVRAAMVNHAQKLKKYVEENQDKRNDKAFQEKVNDDLIELIGMHDYVLYDSAWELWTKEDKDLKSKLAKERENDKPKKERYE